MELREEILKEHSKRKCTEIVQWVGNSQQRFDELFKLFTSGEYRVAQRAAWPVSYCVGEHPELINKNFTQLINLLEKLNVHDAVKRNTLRLLQETAIPKKLQGKVMAACFDFVASPKEAVAIKAFALTVLHKLSKLYPEIIPEIKLIIQDQLPHQTAAFKSRAILFLKDVPAE